MPNVTTALRPCSRTAQSCALRKAYTGLWGLILTVGLLVVNAVVEPYTGLLRMGSQEVNVARYGYELWRGHWNQVNAQVPI